VTKHHHPKREVKDAQPQAEDAQPAVTPAEAAKPQAEAVESQAEAAEPEAAPGAEAAPIDTGPSVEEMLAQLRAELATAKDRELRCHAELDNYRKRAARELEERLRYANLGLLRDLLPVLDNVERAIQAAETNAEAGALVDGFKLVCQQLEDVLDRHHCKRIEALHTPFDPHVHHAMLQQPSEEHPANTVLMVTQNGYQLHDRVVRPSQVIVSKPK
jgi:molecular chaperone GrpE